MHNNNNNNNNTNAHVYGAIIMAEPLQEFIRFMDVEWRQAAANPQTKPT